MAINALRIELFEQLGRQLQACLLLKDHDKRKLAYNRIYFFMVYGIVSTYAHSLESLEALMDRLDSTFEEAFDALLTGLKSKAALIEEENE